MLLIIYNIYVKYIIEIYNHIKILLKINKNKKNNHLLQKK